MEISSELSSRKVVVFNTRHLHDKSTVLGGKVNEPTSRIIIFLQFFSYALYVSAALLKVVIQCC